MASAMFDPQNNHFFSGPGSEPDQEYNQPCTNFDPFWQPNELEWNDLNFIDLESIDMNWMSQPLDESGMAPFPGFLPSLDANMEGAFLPANAELVFPPPHPAQLSPPLTSSSSSSSSCSPSNPSLTASPYAQSPPMPSPTPPTLSSTSTPPEPTKLYTCTTCQPNSSYASLSYLKRHQKRHKKQIACISPTCTDRFAETKAMERHVRTHHAGILPHERYFCTVTGCRYASKGFSREDNLKRHLRNVHGLDP